ncbi:hypothetical protein N7481_013385 [Penicillium waksmanii]|uniref:uncharacterized protein n=1 Tax=Penicillium waksmanii TaxID=69791 RepID=UPI00254791BF|nr:uncharacterized protein N7481_013385 [Penicillium waksmanii]KAJ5963080.1 hypothetical protein N7481_013385 [Penicillium waksmanii]
MDIGLDEAAVVVFYAWYGFPHGLRELTMLRTMLGERYGKVVHDIGRGKQGRYCQGTRSTSEVIARAPIWVGFGVELPSRDRKAYGVDWPEEDILDSQEDLGSARPEFVKDTTPGDGDNNQEGNVPATPTKPRADITESRRASETSELSKATPPRGPAAGRSPVSVAPPAPRTDNPNPHVNVPGSEGDGSANTTSDAAGSGSQGKSNNGGIPELDELTRRFADLKRNQLPGGDLAPTPHFFSSKSERSCPWTWRISSCLFSLRNLGVGDLSHLQNDRSDFPKLLHCTYSWAFCSFGVALVSWVLY